MQNKPSSKSWNDVQLVIASIAVALTLGFWNLFASPERRPLGGAEAAVELPPQPVGATIAPQPLQPGQVVILNGAAAPQAPSQPQVTTSRSRKNKGGGGAVTTTSSSR